jgi:hypothetical protein
VIVILFFLIKSKGFRMAMLIDRDVRKVVKFLNRTAERLCPVLCPLCD